MQNVLVTGPMGFIGSHLLKRLKKSLDFNIIPFEGDLLSSNDIESHLNKASIHQVIHLAGISHPIDCENDPSKAFQINVAGTQLLAEKLLLKAPLSTLYFFSTAQVYRDSQLKEATESAAFAIDEKHEVEAQNTYARSKLAGETILKSVYSQKLKIRILRLFNHTHKSQQPNAFLPRVYKELLNAPKGQTLNLKLGNVDLIRDFSSIQSLLEKINLLINNEKGFNSNFEIFNVSSGVGLKLRDLVQFLAFRLNLDVNIILDPSRLRTGEPNQIIGDSQKLMQHLKQRPIDLMSYKNRFVEEFLADLE
jgi:GDP-4-dehydro-6-deoxy-D-mannose reductase